MKTLGLIMGDLLLQMIFKIILVLFILSRIILMVEDILGGSTSSLLERLRAKKER